VQIITIKARDGKEHQNVRLVTETEAFFFAYPIHVKPVGEPLQFPKFAWEMVRK